ncbi:phosphoenolpyruvate--protein phosphotransferase [Desulfatiglans anilini]|uniref:phosphoenolpyruvate--protein phosphotransferase n=1 Tax=Desulfatiglans anilini TaxID=90728 RepID=UPI001FC963F2|nr:phosphoenolpyruvate--protein phosphotransferase [Desulfatiglans anilini]
MNQCIEGLALSPGIGMGPVFRLRHLMFEVSGRKLEPEEAALELGRLEAACREVAAVLHGMEDSAAREALLAMLESPLFHGSITDRIQSGRTAADAVVQTVNDLAVIFGELPDPVLRARAGQAEEVGRHLFRQLHGLPIPLFRSGSPVVIVTDEMSAFDATRLQPGLVAGIVCERGGVTSHLAIIIKQIGIPAVSGIHGALGRFEDGELCICDGEKGVVLAAPDENALQAVRDRLAGISADRAGLAALAARRTATRDGKPIGLWGNIAGPADIQAILDAGGTGVGMFRTEFVFVGDEAPSEERQAYIYEDILSRVPGPVVMRTLEAGGDKTIPYLAGEAEENPNLGWQGLRMCLDIPDLFLTQLRAMIRASRAGELWIMFPFVSALWELRECRRLVAEADAAVRRDGVRPGDYKVGIMVEVPSAAVMAKEYLRDFDFCSIGTNDLTQFTLAADRMNPKVARWYDPFHPAVLRLIALTAHAAERAGKPIGMAGDMASNPLAIPVLIGLGFSSLSATAPRIPEVKKTILTVDSEEARHLARSVLALEDADQVKACLRGEAVKGARDAASSGADAPPAQSR